MSKVKEAPIRLTPDTVAGSIDAIDAHNYGAARQTAIDKVLKRKQRGVVGATVRRVAAMLPDFLSDSHTEVRDDALVDLLAIKIVKKYNLSFLVREKTDDYGHEYTFVSYMGTMPDGTPVEIPSEQQAGIQILLGIQGDAIGRQRITLERFLGEEGERVSSRPYLATIFRDKFFESLEKTITEVDAEQAKITGIPAKVIDPKNRVSLMG